MKIEIVGYEPVHAYHILDRQVRETEFMLSTVGDWEQAARDWGRTGPAFTLLLDGEPEACGGIALRDPTLGECWLLVPRINHGCIIYRCIIKKLQELIATRNFRRLQAHVMTGFESGERLVKRLGFEYEGSLRNFGPNGETIELYARIF